MKRFLFLPLAALAAAMMANVNAQDKPRAEANHSVSLSVPMGAGLHYGYELPIGRLGTITGRVGADAGAAWGQGFFGDYGFWMIAPSVDIEPRWYYGLDRRAAKGRSTAGNQGSFLAINIKNILPFGYVSDSLFEIVGATVFTPQWGMRRVWSDHLLFEFSAGVNIGLPWAAGGYGWSPDLKVRFGYKF